MKKLKVLIVHNYYQIPGGEDTVVKNESNLLKENGHEVILYTRHNNELKKKGILGKIVLPFETIFSFKTYREVKELIKKNDIDIVHVHNTLPLISPSVYYAAFNCKVPVVQTIHNFRLLCPAATLTRDGKICEECIRKGLKSALKHKCYRNSFLQTLVVVMMLAIHRAVGTYNKVNGYIALTEFSKNKLRNLLKEEKKIFIKPNFVKNQSKIVLPRLVENYFVFIGRLDKLKGVNLLLEAWLEVKDTELYIIGEGPEKQKLEWIIKENNIRNVKLTGFLPMQEALDIVSKSKAVIIPSQLYEVFGMVAIEAFSVGVPVIASNIGALSKIVNETNGLLFQYDNKRDLIEKINLLNNDKEMVDKLSAGALDTFNKLYSDKINYQLLMKIYKFMLGDKVEEV